MKGVTFNNIRTTGINWDCFRHTYGHSTLGLSFWCVTNFETLGIGIEKLIFACIQ